MSTVSSGEFQMRTWWREWNRRITGEELPPELHDPPDGFFRAPRLDSGVARADVAAS